MNEHYAVSMTTDDTEIFIGCRCGLIVVGGTKLAQHDWREFWSEHTKANRARPVGLSPS